MSGMWRDKVRYDPARSIRRRADRSSDKKREWNFGISAAQPGQTGEPGGTDGACLGCICGQLQRSHPGTYVFASEKAQGGAWI